MINVILIFKAKDERTRRVKVMNTFARKFSYQLKNAENNSKK